MKKLIAMIGAAVMSFGLFAALDPSVEFQTLRYKVADKGFEVGPTNIVGYDDLSVKNVFTGGTVNWFAENFPTGDVGLVDYEQPAEVAEEMFNETPTKVLKIEADTAYPMLRTFGPVQRTATSEGASYSKPTFDIGTFGLFADAKVKLSASEEAPQDFDGKIAVWLQVIPEEKDDQGSVTVVGSTNLMVTCGQLNADYQLDGVTNIVIAADGVTVNPDEWHRITIRSIKKINDDSMIPGFVIYIDGEPAEAAEGAYTLPTSGLTEKAQEFADKHELFASAVVTGDNAQKLESVGFAGNGSLSYIDLTDAYNAPLFAVDPTEVLIKWDAHVASIIIDGEDITAGVDGYQVAYLVTNFNQTIEATVAYEPGTPGYRGKSITGTGFADDKFTALTDKMGFNFEVNQFREGAVVQVVSEFDRDEALVTVDGDVKPMYSSLADALADINMLYTHARNVKIEIGESVVTLSDKKYLNSFKGNLVIDLKGNTIQFTYEPGDGEEAYGIVNNGTLTIQDTSDNGGGKMESVNGIPLIYNILATTIAKATGANDIVIDGSVLNENVYFEGEWFPGEITVLGGKFREKVVCFCTADGNLPQDWKDHLEDEITLGTQAIPLKWSDAQTDGFWTLEFAGANLVVEDNEGVTFTFTTNDVPVAEGVEVVPLSSGMTAEIVATLKGHYEFADVEAAEAAGWVFAGDDTVATTNIAAIVEVATGITVTIPATKKIEYTITPTGGDNAQVGLDPAGGKATYGETVEITAIPDEHYTYEGVELPAGWGTNECGSATNTVTVTGDDTIAVPNATAIVVTSVTLDQTSLEVVEGADPVKLVATVEPADALVTTVTWESDNTEVATVAADGTVTFGAAGEATITAKVGDVSATCTVTVTAAGPTVYFPQADIEEQYKDRNGTEALPFVIRKYDDLVALKNGVANGTITTQYFEQVADINFDGEDPWTGIGTGGKSFTTPFKGTYDGNGKKIENLVLAAGKYMGLFVCMDGGAISNLTVSLSGTGFADGATGEFGGGAFVGAVKGGTIIKNVTVEGTSFVGQHNLGGICAYANAATFENCTNALESMTANNCDPVGADNQAKLGGILAFKEEGVTLAVFRGCVNKADLSNNAAQGWGTGAILGASRGSDEFYNCRNEGTLTTVNRTVGVLFGVRENNEDQNHTHYVGAGNTTTTLYPACPVYSSDTFTGAHQYAMLLANGDYEYVETSAFEAGKTFATVKGSLTPAYTFTEAGTIAFNTNLYKAAAFNVTGDPAEKFDITSTEAAGVVTFTAAVKQYTVKFIQGLNGETTNDFEVAYGGAMPVTPEITSVAGYNADWDSDPAGVTAVTSDLTFTANYTPVQLTVTITLNGATLPTGWTSADENVTATTNFTVESETFTLPELTKTDFVFEGYVKAGETTTNKTVTITKGTTASASYTACFTAKAEEPDVPVDEDDEELTDKGKENATAAANAIKAGGEEPAAWVEKVYGTDGKIPAAKLNAASATAIALAVANDLPITVEEPKFDVEASTVSEGTDNVAAFEFTLKDGATAEQIKALTEKVRDMVKYTATLGSSADFQRDDARVAVTLTDNGKIKAELKKVNGVNAGFMKVEPQPATTGGL